MKFKENKEKRIAKATFEKLAVILETSAAAAAMTSILERIPVAKKLTKMSLKKKRITYTSFFLVMILGVGTVASGYFKGEEDTLTYTEYTVNKGDLTLAITGDGTVEPLDQYTVISLVEGDVLEDTFEEGDTVSKGALLYQIDSSDMEKTLEKANISYEKTMMSYQDSVDAYNGLTITAPISGKITALSVEKGDNISSGSQVATMVDDTTLIAKVPFSTDDVNRLSVGASATVTVANTFEQLNGKITKIYSTKRMLDGYIEVTDVEVQIENPGALESGIYVSVTSNGIDCYSSGTLDAKTEKVVLAKNSGLVTKVVASEGEYLSKGDVIATLSNDSASDDLLTSQLSLRESELSYQSSQEQLDEYSVTAPISGTVIEKDIKAGDTLDSSNSGSQTLCVIADMSAMTVTINVDELDIAQLDEGQEVTITADALSNQTFTGYVDNIGILGTTSDGVTSYPVKIVINDSEDLWPGMNVNASIIVDSVKDVLQVPVAAVNRGNTVLVKGAEATDGMEQSGAPSGSSYVRIEIGLNDESYIEVTSGLSEGDVVLVPVVASSGESETSQSQDQMMPGGGGGDMGGGGMSGPPSGGGGPGM